MASAPRKSPAKKAAVKPSGARGPVEGAVRRFVDGLDVEGDDLAAARAALAVSLAQSLDAGPERELPAVSKELRATLSELAEVGDDDEFGEWQAQLGRPDGG